MIVGIHEELPASTMRRDVIHIGGTHPGKMRKILLDGSAEALPAEGLPEQLRRTQLILPDRQLVPPVPCRRFRTAALSIRLTMPLTVAGANQLTAAGMSTGTKCSTCHYSTPPDKRKACTWNRIVAIRSTDLRAKRKACTKDRIIAIHGTGSRARARGEYLRSLPGRIVCI